MTFGELLDDYNRKRGWGISKQLRNRKFIEVS